MRGWKFGVALLCLTTTAGFAGDDPAAGIADAKRLMAAGEFTEAADAYERYLKAHPKAKDVFAAYSGAFHARVQADDESGAKKAGKRVFKYYPDARGTFAVLSTWLERSWKVPTLSTSYHVLRRWTFDRVDAVRAPDLRLAFLDVIANQHKRSELVKNGGLLYCQAWAHMTAGRFEQAIKLGKKYLRTKPSGSSLDRARLVVAEALLKSTPARVKEATTFLKLVIENEKSSQRGAAQDMLASAGLGPASIQITKGFPTADGLGKIVVLTNLSKSSPRRKALEPWRVARDAEVVTFKGDVATAASKLRKHGAEYVAVVVEPSDLDNNFQLAMLELCRSLDDDPMPDFHFGYLVTRDAADLGALTARILEKEKSGGTKGKDVGVPRSFASLDGLDFLIHYGHGTSRRIVKGLSATEVAGLTLADGPVIVSGACFNGVCSRTHERFILGNHHGKPDELAVDQVLSLAWLHAGATGLFAALDGDRGEMAGAEWEYFREHAPRLGDVIGHQYRLIYTSLRESYERFPRYDPGRAKDKSFYGVMLRGQTSRVLFSDPMYRPLHQPLSSPTIETKVTHDALHGGLSVRIEMLRHANGPFVNTLPTRSGTPFRETRLYARVALPRGFQGTLGFPTVDTGGLKLSKVQAKHEVWGGQRYVNVQAESENWKLTKRGRVTTFTFKKHVK